jgi:hypothetical protein
MGASEVIPHVSEAGYTPTARLARQFDTAFWTAESRPTVPKDYGLMAWSQMIVVIRAYA